MVESLIIMSQIFVQPLLKLIDALTEADFIWTICQVRQFYLWAKVAILSKRKHFGEKCCEETLSEIMCVCNSSENV